MRNSRVRRRRSPRSRLTRTELICHANIGRSYFHFDRITPNVLRIDRYRFIRSFSQLVFENKTAVYLRPNLLFVVYFGGYICRGDDRICCFFFRANICYCSSRNLEIRRLSRVRPRVFSYDGSSETNATARVRVII